MSFAIEIDNISKLYRINRQVGPMRNRTLGDDIRRLITYPLRQFQRGVQSRFVTEELWALKDVSFQVGRGEIVGVVGHNGAGKSTLMKIISRIARPTKGMIRYHGRVASLLGVGAGFRKELSGRENVMLNGAILGMDRAEIRRNFDAIVEFSGIERFLDTPVKRYSNGMRSRLAFAVAAHITPEILILDEVLAVGDVPFRRRCMDRMRELSLSGRTIMIVSHRVDAMKSLCHRCVMLEHGHIVANGDPTEVLAKYAGVGNEAA